MPNWTPFSRFHSRFFFCVRLGGSGRRGGGGEYVESIRTGNTLPSPLRDEEQGGDARGGAKKSTNIFQGCSSKEGGGRRFISAQGIVLASSY